MARSIGSRAPKSDCVPGENPDPVQADNHLTGPGVVCKVLSIESFVGDFFPSVSSSLIPSIFKMYIPSINVSG